MSPKAYEERNVYMNAFAAYESLAFLAVNEIRLNTVKVTYLKYTDVSYNKCRNMCLKYNYTGGK